MDDLNSLGNALGSVGDSVGDALGSVGDSFGDNSLSDLNGLANVVGLGAQQQAVSTASTAPIGSTTILFGGLAIVALLLLFHGPA